MKRQSTLRARVIGNGVFAQVSRRESLLEVYRRIMGCTADVLALNFGISANVFCARPRGFS